MVLRIVMPVTRMLDDDDLDLFLDGVHVGKGSYNKGVDLWLTTTAGPHVLEVGQDVTWIGGTVVSALSPRQFRKSWKLPLAISGPGERVARIKYSRMWGKFVVEVG